MSAPHPPRPLVVVTRPADQAQDWIVGLRAAGWPVLTLPLIDIVPAADAARLQAAVNGWADLEAVMMVSPSAVGVLHRAGVSAPQPPLRCWAPGGGTARALIAWGVPLSAIDQPAGECTQLESEALWPVIAAQVRPGFRLLIVRGVSVNGHAGRDWLMQRCRSAGAAVRTLTAYRRRPPSWDTTQRAQARQAIESGAVWLLSSSEAIAHLHDQLPGAPWDRARAVATHPRIAKAARASGWRVLGTCRPILSEIEQTLESTV